MSTARTGGRLLIDQLVAHGTELVFCVPGESYLAALDALHDTPQIRLIAGRMEASSANMACAHGQLTGRPGIFFASRGPGAAQASVAVHTARQGSVPMIMFVGQVPRAHRDREAFQEVDIDAMFAPLAKWTATVEDPARIPEYVSRAYRVATSGRPGPVVLSLPEDVLTESADVPDAARTAQAPAPTAAPSRACGSSSQPPSDRWSSSAVAAGPSAPPPTRSRCASPGACRWRPRFAARTTSTTARRCTAARSAWGSIHGSKRRVRESDLLLVIGARLDEPTTGGYEMIEAPRPRQALIHVHADPDELGRVFEPTLGICAGSAEFVAAARALDPPDGARFADWTAAAAADARAFRTPRRGRRRRRSGRARSRAVRRAAAGNDRDQRRRQLHALGPSLLAVSAVREPGRAGQRRDGLRRAGGDRRQAGRARGVRWCRSTATAAS